MNSRTVSGNVALPLELGNLSREQIKKRVSELLDLVGLSDKHDSWPANLSGGQKQRVAIARALASNPKVLLCDEATSALDPATTRSILELLKDINRRLGITILLITHEMDVVKRICDQVAVISNGELIEKDSVSEVFSHPKTPLAQQFIQSTLHLDIPDDYQQRMAPQPTADSVPLLRLEFTGKSVDAPLLSESARRFNVNNNIISAQMDYAGGVKFGIMLAEMDGSETDTQAAIAWLKENHVKVEVLGYV
jgi:D-methionine transport system ATP-binding protein